MAFTWIRRRRFVEIEPLQLGQDVALVVVVEAAQLAVDVVVLLETIIGHAVIQVHAVQFGRRGIHGLKQMCHFGIIY